MVAPETPARLEPCALDSFPAPLADSISAITGVAASLGSRLHPHTAASLASLVRVMNCYYSNLIEGHDTRPRDIERALFNQLETAGERRNLQLEARAHVRLRKPSTKAMPRPLSKSRRRRVSSVGCIGSSTSTRPTSCLPSPARMAPISCNRVNFEARLGTTTWWVGTCHDRAGWCRRSWTISNAVFN